jgi:hypothetical protein
MKYCTLEWWHGIQCGDVRDPWKQYQAHFQRIRDRLPSSLIDLHENVSMHDANLVSMTLLPADTTLLIELSGDDGQGGARTFHLEYSGVERFFTLTGAELPGPTGFGDLGYEEVHLVDDELIEHDLLFSSGIELQIIFADLQLTWTDA